MLVPGLAPVPDVAGRRDDGVVIPLLDPGLTAPGPRDRFRPLPPGRLPDQGRVWSGGRRLMLVTLTVVFPRPVSARARAPRPRGRCDRLRRTAAGRPGTGAAAEP